MRRWLERNKVYFETVAAAALSVMAVVLAVQGNRIAKLQIALAERQTRVAEAVAAPFVRVGTRFVLNPATGFFDDDILTVSNHGAPVRGVSVDPITFLHFRITRAGDRMPLPDSFSVVLNGYYFAISRTQSATGLLLEGMKPGNNLVVWNLERSLHDLVPGVRFDALSVRRFVALSYQDPLGANAQEYFALDELGDRRLDPSMGEALRAEMRIMTARGMVLDIDRLAPEAVRGVLERSDSLRAAAGGRRW